MYRATLSRVLFRYQSGTDLRMKMSAVLRPRNKVVVVGKATIAHCLQTRATACMNAVRKPKKTAAESAAKTEASKASTKQTAAAAATSSNSATAREATAFSLDPIFAAIAQAPAGLAPGRGDDLRRIVLQAHGRRRYPHHAPEAWAALACDMLEFARVRKPGAASVRVFNASQKLNGWESQHTVLQIVNDDMPFLVDSVSMALADAGIGVHVLGHPLLRFTRDKAGKVTAVGEGKPESLMLLEIDRQPAEQMPLIEARIRKVLGEVRAIVQDWSAMREKMLALADELATRRMPVDDAGRREAQEFLRWAAGDHFTFFGYREYRVEKNGSERVLVADEGGLGLLRGKDQSTTRNVKSLAAHYIPQSGSVDTLILTKTKPAPPCIGPATWIHRRPRVRHQGQSGGEQRFIGLYTSSAYNAVRGRFRWCASATNA